MSASAPASRPHRFASVSVAPPDPILGLSEAFAADPNPHKMNLSMGVYKDASGGTPILASVKEAERRLIAGETTKSYLPIDGLPDYRAHVRSLLFGEGLEASRVSIAQTPGGTGALRVAAEFLADQVHPKRVWVSNPTWANHVSIFAAAGIASEVYRYLGDDKKSLDFAGMMDDLRTKASPGDVVLLHACCHNPSGIDPTTQQWSELAVLLAERNLLPMVDFAYQGFGAGLREDAQSIATLLGSVDDLIVCSSFSKNFGLYSERVGAVAVVAAAPEESKAVQSQLKRIVRSNYSNPPRHGASIVATVLSDPELSAAWEREVDEMRERIFALRRLFVDGMAKTAPGRDFSFLLDQKGMFSFSGLTPMQVDELKARHGIYIVGSGRMNVAGMVEDQMDYLCQSVASVL